MACNVLRWLGSGEVCTDHLTLICRPEDRERVAEEIAEAALFLLSDRSSFITGSAMFADGGISVRLT